MGKVDFSVLEHFLAYGALIVLVLESCLLVVVHMSLGGAQVLALPVTDRASQIFGIEVCIVVVFTHMRLVVTLKPEVLEQKKVKVMLTYLLNYIFYNIRADKY